VIARWPGKSKPGSESDHVSAFWDFLPTCAELLGETPPKEIDAISMLPTLLGQPDEQTRHKCLYWRELNGQQAVRMGDWKAVRPKPGQKTQLFSFVMDTGERIDVADEQPQIIAQIEEIFTKGRTESEVFPLQKPKAGKK
jgi:arylsulfatase A